MALTKEDLQAIGDLIDTKLEPISAELSEVKLLTADLSADLSEVKLRVRRMELTQENITNKRLDVIGEGVAGMQEKFDKLDRIEARQEDHDHRIWALEQAHKAE